MPIKPLRPCRHAGCGALTRDGYCERHQSDRNARVISGDWHWMYGTSAWRRELRPQQLLREPFCRECAAEGRRTKAIAVDHIKPHRGVWSVFVDKANLQSLCKRHHDAKTMRELMQSRETR